MEWYNNFVEDNRITGNRFLTDYSIKEFIFSLENQEYKLSISSTINLEGMVFYTTLKPLDYDHIIFMSDFSSHWPTAKKLFEEVVSQVADKYNINIEDIVGLTDFINR